jgi:Tfp pilus assembly protein PilF
MLDSLLEKDKNNPEFRLMHAGLLEQRGLVAEATAEMLQIVQTAPANPRVRFACAMMLARTGQQAQASSEFNMAIQNDPGNTSYRIQAGMFFLSINDPYQALTHFEAAVRNEPKSAEAHAWYAQTLQVLGRLPEAQREIESALQMNGRDTRILGTAGGIHMQVNRPDLAEREFRTAIEQNPQNFAAYAQLASLYWIERRAQDFQWVMQRMMQLNPQMAQQVQQYLQMQGAAQAAPGYGQPPQFRPQFAGGPGWGQQPPGGDAAGGHWLSALSKLLGS